MIKTCRLTVLAAASFGMVCLSASRTAVAQGDSGVSDSGGTQAAEGDDDAFNVGGSCAALAYLSLNQLKAFIGSGYSDDFHSFCFPEQPSECSDYTPLLQGLGHLTTGEDGYHCSLQL